MKKILSIMALSLIPSFAMADIVTLPKSKCNEILSFEYSSGNGDTAFHQIDVLCKSADGKFYGFVVEKVSVAGMFGMGRLDLVDQVTFNMMDVADASWK